MKRWIRALTTDDLCGALPCLVQQFTRLLDCQVSFLFHQFFSISLVDCSKLKLPPPPHQAYTMSDSTELLCALALQHLIRDGFRLYSLLTMMMIIALDHLKSMSIEALQTLLQHSASYRRSVRSLVSQKFCELICLVLQTIQFQEWCDGLIAARMLKPEMAVDFNSVRFIEQFEMNSFFAFLGEYNRFLNRLMR